VAYLSLRLNRINRISKAQILRFDYIESDNVMLHGYSGCVMGIIKFAFIKRSHVNMAINIIS